jgi:hypothetical protein
VTVNPGSPIFIHGILQRSGTNFLWDLLRLHPDCAPAREPIREDLFLEHSDHLQTFVDTVRSVWDPIWGNFPGDLPDRLCASIGDGLLSFLRTDFNRRLLTKSPSVRHLDRFFRFFPSAQLLILVRDGRAVAQSGVDTFGWDFDRVCRAWASGADTIRRFQQAESGRANRWRLVRYEDLVDDTEGQLRSVFEFLGLDSGRYDFDAARKLPVRGSSWFGRQSTGVHWDAVPKDASFAPKERWRSLSPDYLDRFEWLAGEQLRAFGYDAPPSGRFITRSIKHTLRDWRWGAVTGMRSARVRVGTASRPLRRRVGLFRDAGHHCDYPDP